jgi:hypothetical protein
MRSVPRGAPEGRKKLGHGASRGNAGVRWKTPEEAEERRFFRPSGAVPASMR